MLYGVKCVKVSLQVRSSVGAEKFHPWEGRIGAGFFFADEALATETASVESLIIRADQSHPMDKMHIDQQIKSL